MNAMFANNQIRPANVTYGCTALVGTNKTGLLKPDADGYYTMVVGALGVFNSAGQYYVWNEQVKALFDSSSAMQRRVADGSLRGEYGHPRPSPNMKPSDFLARVLDIFEPNVCCHFRKITLDFNNVRDAKGQMVVAIVAEVKPSGPMGPALAASLANPSENVCYSIRSLTTDSIIGGGVQKLLRTIVTFDNVNEPGISVAKKWNAPSLEGLVADRKFSPAQLRLVVDNTKAHGRGLESINVAALELERALGWDRADPNSPILMPKDLMW
jgi:hypothetical protein